MARFLIAITLAGLVAGCGDGGAANNADAGPPPCKMTLTGEKTGTFDCVAGASEQDGTHATLMGVVAQGLPGTLQTASVSFMINGAPEMKHYAAADLNGGGALVQTSDEPPVSYSAGAGAGAKGTIDGFDIDQVFVGAHNGTTQLFAIHGSFSGTLVNAAGGSISMTATF